MQSAGASQAAARRARAVGSWCAGIIIAAALAAVPARAQDAKAAEQAKEGAPAEEGAPEANPEGSPRFDIWEFQVEGNSVLPAVAVEEAVYPFLGEAKTLGDVEAARQALERVYQDKGYQTVLVDIPEQQVQDGLVRLRVTEGRIDRLRVRGSRYFALGRIKEAAPSLAEGTVPNFPKVQEDIVALNQVPDRKVTPVLKAGRTPGTVDVDLQVEDKLPLHASVELNDRYNQNTSRLRTLGSVSYGNLWQLGHSVNLSYQIAPQNPNDAKIFSGSYLAPVTGTPLSLLLYGVKSDSDVASVGSIDVIGRGEIIGGRAIVQLPAAEGFVHSFTVGGDYKHFDEILGTGGTANVTPITYYPFTLGYSASLQELTALTQFNIAATVHFRGMGSDLTHFDNKRFNAKPDFAYLKADVSRTEDLPAGLVAFARLEGQVTDQPLISNEQFYAGGVESVRGYLEAERLGDYGARGTFELRSPSVAPLLPDAEDLNDWRFVGFLDGAQLFIYSPLPSQRSGFHLIGIGGGTRVKMFDRVNAAVDVAVPVTNGAVTRAGVTRVHFRLWSEF